MPRRKKIPRDIDLQKALREVRLAADRTRVRWALVGGQSLRLHGFLGFSTDVDVFAPAAGVVQLADCLVDEFDWFPMEWDSHEREFVEADEVVITEMFSDPITKEVGEPREMVALQSPEGVDLDILTAQHPIEKAVLRQATPSQFEEETVLLAPLGGVMLLKAKIGRAKDTTTLIQLAELLGRVQLDEAVAWARDYDVVGAERLRRLIDKTRRERNVGARSRRPIR